MVRTLSIADSLLTSSHESKQRSKRFETGLLIAQQGSKADTILRLVPTPNAEEGKEATALDSDWVLAHAGQVARMLPGGIVVLGMYVLAPNAKLSTMEPKLQQLLASLAGGATSRAGADAHSVALLFPTDAKKPMCRSFVPGAAKLKPLEIRTVREAPALRCVASDVELAVPLRLSSAQCAEGPTARVRAALQAQIRRHLGNLLGGAIVTVDGAAPASGALVEKLRGKGTLQSPHAVRFFAASPSGRAAPVKRWKGDVALAQAAKPPEDDDDYDEAAAAATGGDDDAATAPVEFVLRGVVHGRAFTTAREPVDDAVAALVADVEGSALQRAALLVEDMQEYAEEEEDDDDDEGGGGGGFAMGLVGGWPGPRRVHVPVGGGLSLCDYVSPGEGLDDCAERLGTLLGHALPDGGVAADDIGPEVEAESTMPKQLDPAVASSSAGASAKGGGGGASGSAMAGAAGKPGSSGTMLAAIGAAAVALLAGVVTLAMSGSDVASDADDVADDVAEAAADAVGAAAEAVGAAVEAAAGGEASQ